MKTSIPVVWCYLIASFVGVVACSSWLLLYWNTTESDGDLVFIFLFFFWCFVFLIAVFTAYFPPRPRDESVRSVRCIYQAGHWTLNSLLALSMGGLYFFAGYFNSPEKVLTLTRNDVLVLWLLFFCLTAFFQLSYYLYLMRRPKKNAERKSPKFSPRSQYDIPWERRTDSKFRLP